MPSEDQANPSFFARIGLAWRVLFDALLAGKVAALTLPAPEPAEVPPEKVHASGLFVLSALQQEGRFIDFVQQEIAGFSDEEIGAAARVVHSGCRKAVQKYVGLDPVRTEQEGDAVTVPDGFDPQRIRLTGNVTGHPPFKGTLRHPGWAARDIRLPDLNPALDARILAPAEVELA